MNQPLETAEREEDGMRSGVRKNRLILIVLWFAFYCSFALFTPPLLDDADSVHAEVAREMLLRHDWTTLYANGIRYLEKAPLFYWSMAGCMKMLGATTVASRLPLALAVLGLALTLESFGRRAFRAFGKNGPRDAERSGLYSGLVVLSSFGIFIFSRINIPDVMVCLWLTLAMGAYFQSEGSELPRRLVCYGFATACALNILTKGLIGIVFPVGIVGLHLLATRGWRSAVGRVRQLYPLSSLTVFLALAVPWHVLAGLANPAQGHPGGLERVNGRWQVPYPTDGNVHGWTWFYFVNEQVYRYLNLRVPHDYDTAPLVVFYGLILVWLMPWSAYLIPAVKRAMPLRVAEYRSRLRGLRLDRQEKTNLLLVLWAAIPLVFFSLSTRQEYYVLPSLPPLILLIAGWLAGDSNVVVRLRQAPGEREGPPVAPATAEFLGATGAPSKSLRGPFTVRVDGSSTGWAIVLLTLGSVAAVGSVSFLLKTSAPGPETDLASLLQQNPGDYALSFGHFLDLNAKALGLFRVPLAMTAVALLGGTLANFFLRKRNEPHAANLCLAAGAFLFLLAAHRGLVIFSPTLTSYQLARAIAPQVRAEDLIVLHGEYESGSTLGFYLRRNDLHIVEGRSSNLWYGSFFPDAPRIFETRESIAERWKGPQRIFLWQDPHDAERPVLALPAPVYVLADSGGRQILSNRLR